MLLITMDDGFEIQWHVGEPRPRLWQVKYYQPVANRKMPYRQVLEVYADGDELQYVLETFTNLPAINNQRNMNGGSRIMWFGDHAAFIAHNL